MDDLEINADAAIASHVVYKEPRPRAAEPNINNKIFHNVPSSGPAIPRAVVTLPPMTTVEKNNLWSRVSNHNVKFFVKKPSTVDNLTRTRNNNLISVPPRVEATGPATMDMGGDEMSAQQPIVKMPLAPVIFIPTQPRNANGQQVLPLPQQQQQQQLLIATPYWHRDSVGNNGDSYAQVDATETVDDMNYVSFPSADLPVVSAEPSMLPEADLASLVYFADPNQLEMGPGTSIELVSSTMNNGNTQLSLEEELSNMEAVATTAFSTVGAVRDLISSSTPSIATVAASNDGYEDPEDFILEDGGGSSNLDISFDMITEQTEGNTTDASTTDPEVRSMLKTQPPTEESRHKGERSLEWYIRQMERKSMSAKKGNGSVKAPINREPTLLELKGGHVTIGKLDNFITIMDRLKSTPLLQYDFDRIKKCAEGNWKPAVRGRRLRSEEYPPRDSSAASSIKGAAATGLKRKWGSMEFALELDAAGGLKRLKAPNLLCDEVILETSSDDEVEPNTIISEKILMPSSAPFLNEVEQKAMLMVPEVEIKQEPVDLDEILLPVMVEGKPFFNYSSHNSLDDMKQKVRECFRPTAMGPEPNGFDFIHWEGNVGLLFGSKMSFFVNEMGLMDLKSGGQFLDQFKVKQEEDQDQGERADDTHLHEEAGTSSTYWQRHMEKKGTFAAPNYLFKHLAEGPQHEVEPNMLVELVDPQNLNHMIIGRVEDKLGGRVSVKIREGDRSYLPLNSWKLLPLGFAGMAGFRLRPLTKEVGLGGNFYKNKDVMDSARKRKSLFEEKTQVEAFDWLGSGELRPASIFKVLWNRLLIVFDSDATETLKHVPRTSFWCTDDSPLIRPINYHQEAHIKLSAYARFNWNRHMAIRRTVPAPPSVFRTRKPLPWREGMQVEAVDRINPHVLRPATVVAVKGYEIKISYDGFPVKDDGLAVWTWDDSEDLFPINWGLRNGHLLVTQEKTTNTFCSNGFCADIGNDNCDRAFHSTAASCPYKVPKFYHATQKDLTLAERFTRFPKLVMNRQVKIPRPDVFSGKAFAALEEKLRVQSKLLSEYSTIRDYGPSFTELSKLWKARAKLLPEAKTQTSPLNWSRGRVRLFINGLPKCHYLGSIFEMNDIDGEALLSLTEHDLSKVLKLKQGVAIKIYNAILKLRVNVVDEIMAGEKSTQ